MFTRYIDFVYFVYDFPDFIPRGDFIRPPAGPGIILYNQVVISIFEKKSLLFAFGAPIADNLGTLGERARLPKSNPVPGARRSDVITERRHEKEKRCGLCRCASNGLVVGVKIDN